MFWILKKELKLDRAFKNSTQVIETKEILTLKRERENALNLISLHMFDMRLYVIETSTSNNKQNKIFNSKIN